MAPDIVFPANQHVFAGPAPVSPLVLADRLLGLAQDADRAGYRHTACRLLDVMNEVLDGGASWSFKANRP